MNDDCKFADLKTGVRLAYVEQGPAQGFPVTLSMPGMPLA